MDDNPKEQEREGFLSTLRKKFSRRTPDEVKAIQDQTELDTFVHENNKKGVINDDETDMIENIIHFSEKEAQDVMVHKSNVSAVDGEETIAQVFNRIMEDGFSRYPVYMGEKDNLVGMFHIRDFLKAYADVSERDVSLKETKYDVVKDIDTVPKTQKISKLFRSMQKYKKHMVAVKGEYGQFKGIVTMEDILEEIFGNIWDEHDIADTGIEEISEGIYDIEGSALLADVEKELEISFDVDDVTTLNGFMTFKLGEVPEGEDEGFAFVYGGYSFTVEEVENRVVKMVRVKKF